MFLKIVKVSHGDSDGLVIHASNSGELSWPDIERSHNLLNNTFSSLYCQKLEIRDAAQTTCFDDSVSYLDIGYHASFVTMANHIIHKNECKPKISYIKVA